MELLEQFIEESFKDLPKGLKTHISTVVEIARELAETHSADASEVYLASKGPVSYTHLTLPTNREV